jgi:hypothetical protein
MSRVETSDIWIGVLAVVSMTGIIYCVSHLTQMSNGQVMYNCSIAEISPDIPVKIKEECRRLKANVK